MRALTCLATAVILASVIAGPRVSAQQAPPAASADQTKAAIKQELEKIKKGRTLGIFPADGTDDSGGATLLRIDNGSPFPIVVLIVGPTTTRVELGPEGMQTLPIEPGAYEIAVTVTGRNVPPFYGTQRIVKNLLFRHQFHVPAI